MLWRNRLDAACATYRDPATYAVPSFCPALGFATWPVVITLVVTVVLPLDNQGEAIRDVF